MKTGRERVWAAVMAAGASLAMYATHKIQQELALTEAKEDLLQDIASELTIDDRHEFFVRLEKRRQTEDL